MKNQREIYEALLDGESLMHTETKVKVRLNADDLLIREDTKDLTSITFISYVEWQIYKEPKWYENIPEGGVLCWVSGNIHVITEYEKLDEIGFKINAGHWCKNPKPLTKQETQVFMNNAPED